MSERGASLPTALLLNQGRGYLEGIPDTFVDLHHTRRTPVVRSSRSGILQKNAEINLSGTTMLDSSLPIPYTEKSELMPFTNPLLPDGQDPWITQKEGEYFYCHTDASLGWTPISVRRSKTLTGLRDAESVNVWVPPESGEASTDVWAPELHYLQNKWYINVAAWSGVIGEPHGMYVLEGLGKDPEDGFEFKGKIEGVTQWAIDGTYFEEDGKLYMVWSGKPEITQNFEVGENGFTSPDNQNLYIAEMENPWTVRGRYSVISTPTHHWEFSGPQPVNEGPQVLRRNNTLNIVFSASNAISDAYCLGILTHQEGDLLDSSAWVKHEDPVFYGTGDIISPGHASFVTSPDGMEDWIVFHAAKKRGSGFDRQIHAQPFTWNADNTPNFGKPVAPGVPIPVPSGEEFISAEEQMKRQREQNERELLPQSFISADSALSDFAAD